MEIKYRKKRLTLEEKRSIIREYNAHMPIVEILTRYKIHKSTLYRVLKHMVQKEEDGNS